MFDFLNMSEVFASDRWPHSEEVVTGVTRQCFCTYTVEEPTAVMAFSDAGEANNPDGTNRVVVEMAFLKDEAINENLAGMILSVTEGLEAEEISADRLHGHIKDQALFALFCHPKTQDSAIQGAVAAGVPIAAHELFPEPGDGYAILIASRGLPGLIAHAQTGSGALIFPQRFVRLYIKLAGTSAWDRLLRDDLLG